MMEESLSVEVDYRATPVLTKLSVEERDSGIAEGRPLGPNPSPRSLGWKEGSTSIGSGSVYLGGVFDID